MTQIYKKIIAKKFDTNMANIKEANKSGTSKRRVKIKKADKPNLGIGKINIKKYTN